MNRTAEQKLYDAIHHWILRHWGNADHCENNCSNSPKRFEWALKKNRVYSRNKTDYLQLCPSCHRKYDWTEEQSRKVSLALSRRKYTKEIRRNMSRGQQGRVIPSDVKAKMAQSQKERWKNRKAQGLRRKNLIT